MSFVVLLQDRFSSEHGLFSQYMEYIVSKKVCKQD